MDVEKVVAVESEKIIRKSVPVIRTVEVPVEYKVEKIIERPVE